MVEDVQTGRAVRFALPSFEEQMALVQQHHLDTLLFCHDPLIKRSSLVLVEQEAFTQDSNEYRKRWRKAVLEALIDLRVGCNFSRRACYHHLGVPA